MHEAALAGTIAERWREAQRSGWVGRPRLIVRGGHHDPIDFDAAVRLHLAIAAPELDPDGLDIIHLAVARLCSGCGRQFMADHPGAPCPECGAAALPGSMEEDVELEWPSAAAT